jgi:hypothetical protein
MRWLKQAVAMAALIGCSDLGPAPDGKQYSLIESGGSFSQDFLATPDTLPAGAVLIRYNSYGSSSCNVPAGGSVATEPSVVTIIAYDVYVPPNTACTADFGRFNRSVTLTLAPGTVELRLRGFVSLGNNVVGNLTRTVVVQ